MSDARRILHIVAGDENWTPTADELRQIVDCFLSAKLTGKDETTVVATRNNIMAKGSIKARILWIDSKTEGVGEALDEAPEDYEDEQD